MNEYDPYQAATQLIMNCVDKDSSGFSDLMDKLSNRQICLLPVPEGTPVAKIDYNQHDGYCTTAVFFQVSMLNGWGTIYFKNRRSAEDHIRIEESKFGGGGGQK